MRHHQLTLFDKRAQPPIPPLSEREPIKDVHIDPNTRHKNRSGMKPSVDLDWKRLQRIRFQCGGDINKALKIAVEKGILFPNPNHDPSDPNSAELITKDELRELQGKKKRKKKPKPIVLGAKTEKPKAPKIILVTRTNVDEAIAEVQKRAAEKHRQELTQQTPPSPAQ